MIEKNRDRESQGRFLKGHTVLTSRDKKSGRFVSSKKSDIDKILQYLNQEIETIDLDELNKSLDDILKKIDKTD